MSLFSLSDIPEFTPQLKSKATSKQIKAAARLVKVMQTCENLIPQIEKDTSIHYVSLTEWSQHELLRHILNKTGAAKVYIATWSMSAPGAIAMIKLCEDQLITELYAILDWRVKVRCPEAHQLAKFNFTKLTLTTCHAKVTVIENENYNISIVTSANYTNNPRIESGVITESKEIADFHKKWIIEVHGNSKPFE